MKAPFSEKLNPRNELTRLGDIDFAGSVTNDILTKTDAGFAFDAMTLSKVSDVVTTNGNLGIGDDVLENSTASNAICIGKDSGSTTALGTLRGDDFIILGNGVGVSQDVQSKSISIGSKEVNSGFNNGTSDEGIGYGSIAIGTSCNGVANSSAKRGNLSVMIGGAAAYNGISGNAVAIGALSGTTNPPSEGSVSIGFNSGAGTSSAVKSKSVSVGESSNIAGSGLQSVAIGYNSNSGGDYSQALGVNAASTGVSSVAIGAGAQAQGVGSIGIGGRYNGGAPYGELGTKAIVIGDGTCLNGNVEENAVVIGASAGLSGAGEDNVLIGAFANSTTGTDQSVCINGTGINLAAVGSGLVVKPIATGSNSDLGTIKRPSDPNFDHYLAYNKTTGEIRCVLHGG